MNEQAVFDALKYRIEVDSSGTRCYYNGDNQLHRMGGPAVEWNNGTKSWYQNGQLHRIAFSIECLDKYLPLHRNGIVFQALRNKKILFDKKAQSTVFFCLNSNLPI